MRDVLGGDGFQRSKVLCGLHVLILFSLPSLFMVVTHGLYGLQIGPSVKMEKPTKPQDLLHDKWEKHFCFSMLLVPWSHIIKVGGIFAGFCFCLLPSILT